MGEKVCKNNVAQIPINFDERNKFTYFFRLLEPKKVGRPEGSKFLLTAHLNELSCTWSNSINHTPFTFFRRF